MRDKIIYVIAVMIFIVVAPFMFTWIVMKELYLSIKRRIDRWWGQWLENRKDIDR